MNEYLVEAYQPRLDAKARRALVERARAAADAISVDGARVSYLRSIFVPADETCFHLFEATSAQDVRAATEWARLSAQRIVEVFA